MLGMKYEGEKWTFSKFIAYEISSGIEGNLIFVVYPLENECDNIIWQGCWPPRFLSSSIFFSAVVGTEAKTSCTLGKHLITDVFP